MCNCKNVTAGGYENQVELPRPSHMNDRTEGSASPTICVDRCLSEEIQHLWSIGIRTTGCCCGHNIATAFIGVINEDIDKMKQNGYLVQFNSTRPNAKDSFIPKTIYRTKTFKAFQIIQQKKNRSRKIVLIPDKLPFPEGAIHRATVSGETKRKAWKVYVDAVRQKPQSHETAVQKENPPVQKD